VGAGGAGTAIAFALAEHRPASLSICDLDTARAVGLVTRVAAAFPEIEVRVTGPAPEGCDLAINATHLGMEESDPLPFPVGRLPRGAVVAEVIMKPPVTRLLREAEQHGLRIHPGRYMMDFQVPQFASFFRLGEGDWRIELAGE
jgi:shikimate dehydrogenase